MEKGSFPRKHTRLEVDLFVIAKVISPADPSRKQRPQSGMARNVSESGLLLELSEALPLSTLLDLLIDLGQRAIRADGEVVWMEPTKGGRPFHHGIRLLKLDAEDGHAWSAYLAKLERAPKRTRARLSAELPVVCRPYGAPVKALEGRTLNISEGGTMARLPEALPPTSAVTLTFQTLKGPMTIGAEVVWVEASHAPEEGIVHGFCFSGPANEQGFLLDLLIASFLNQVEQEGRGGF
ncbi:MAG: PilZ domain-containing protein [candidate division NC10 bacterium]|nr:PilZ domain-containing protein [candidate division NC10 bacterium]